MYNTNAQIFAMKGRFPQFRSKKLRDGSLIFTGKLYIKPEYDEYTVSITYNFAANPIVRILEPEILPNAPHTYVSEGTLCLYHPKLFHWHEYYFVSEYIMGWTASWIYFYEIWKETKVWLGPEAPHENNGEKITAPANNQ